jgi:hypothetical protein
MTQLTVYLARLFGVFVLLMAASMAADPAPVLAAIQSMMHSPGLVLITGVITMAAGVAAVIGHHRWSGGALTVVVTVLCWLTLIKGFVIMAAPPGLLGAIYGFMGYPGGGSPGDGRHGPVRPVAHLGRVQGKARDMISATTAVLASA